MRRSKGASAHLFIPRVPRRSVESAYGLRRTSSLAGASPCGGPGQTRCVRPTSANHVFKDEHPSIGWLAGGAATESRSPLDRAPTPRSARFGRLSLPAAQPIRPRDAAECRRLTLRHHRESPAAPRQPVSRSGRDLFRRCPGERACDFQDPKRLSSDEEPVRALPATSWRASTAPRSRHPFVRCGFPRKTRPLRLRSATTEGS